MATEQNLHVLGIEAGADLTAKQFYFVKIDSNGQLDLAGDAADAIGVLQDAPADNDPGLVGVLGISKVICGGVIAKGGEIGIDTNGKAVAAASGDAVMGYALDTGAANRIIRMALVKKAGVT